MADAPFHLFGIRHHGPGCARSLVRALEDLEPDCLLIEGAPEGEALLPLMLDAAMEPPVAMLIYNPEAARQAVFYPFAGFSPEWNALRMMLARDVPVRFMDLPVAQRFALQAPAAAEAASTPLETEADTAQDAVTDDDERPAADDDADDGAPSEVAADPLDWLARAAGHGDGESWWNHLVEERGDSLDLFAAIAEAMSAVRDAHPDALDPERERLEALREAHMRQCMRQAARDGFERVAVVCGAWHVPALMDMPTAKADAALLKGLGKVKVAATWVPWSYRHLTRASGYGAGVLSPGWYEHLWQGQPADRAVAWLARAARLFRDQDLDCSSAHLIEAARLAETLAALRGRPQAGLEELDEALRTVVCMGEDAPLQLIHDQLVVGERIGATPPEAPAVPLQQDLAREQKRLRIKPEAGQKTLDLDLRQPTHLDRSHLLHRLAVLDVDWGRLGRVGHSAKGSFHEIWTLQWAPEMAIAVIDASRWGNTVADAATARAVDIAAKAERLPELARLIDRVLLADLPEAIGPVSRALEDRAAVANDVGQLLDAIPALANVVRYGNVRRTDAGMVLRVLERLVPRAAIGLPQACTSLDDEAAETLRAQVAGAHQALPLVDDAALLEQWRAALGRIAANESCHALVAGLAARLLFDDRVDDVEATARRMSLALSAASDPAAAAAWLTGFLNDSGMVLVHDDDLWALVDAWLTGLPEAVFMHTLPLLRRAFARFSEPERRQLGERVRHGPATASRAAVPAWDPARALQAVPVLKRLWGIAP